MENNHTPDEPIIDELTFSSEEPAAEERPASPALPEIPAETEYPAEAEVPEEPAETLQETGNPEPGSQTAPPSFMERIPDVEEDYPPEEDYSDLVVIDDEPSAEEIQAPVTEESDEIAADETLELVMDEDDTIDQEYRDTDQEFQAVYDTSRPTPPPARPHPPRKGRPKRRKGEGLLGIPNILVTVVWLALILAIGVTAGRLLWLCAADVLAFGQPDKPVTITIYEGDDMDAITEKLHAGGLIRYKGLFSFYADISDAQEDIKPGIYDLNTRYDYHALVNFMSPKSNRSVVELTIPEGYTCRQIFQLLEENRVCTALDAARYAANGELEDYWFLEGVERGTENCLEGYLFPDTYEFYKNSTPREALQRMLNNFDVRFDEEMRNRIAQLNAEQGSNYTVREITIIASLIEKESAAPAESPRVSGVIYNRLFRWGDTPPYLNIDASIVYAQDGNTESIDTRMDSPYNTYTNIGLTPGPISNPGLSSLRSALYPESHNYYYYVLNPSTGMHQFSHSQDEHNAWIKEFYGD